MIRRKLPTGATQALIPEMARKTKIDTSEDLDIEMKSISRALKVLKEIKREIRRKSKLFRRELRKIYKKIMPIERSNPKTPKFSQNSSTKLREKNKDSSDKGSKVSCNTLNEGSKSTILILLPKFSGRILTNFWGFYCSFYSSCCMHFN